MRASKVLSVHLRMPEARSVRETRELIGIGLRLVQAPDLTGIHVQSEHWLAHAERIERAILAAQRLEETHQRYDSVFKPAAWSCDLSGIRTAYKIHVDNQWRFTNAQFHRAKRQLSKLVVSGFRRDFHQQEILISVLVNAQDVAARLKDVDTVMLKLFGEAWRNPVVNRSYLVQVTDWLQALYRDIDNGALVPQALQYVANHLDQEFLAGAIEETQHTLDRFVETAHTVPGEIGLDEALLFGEGETFAAQPYADQLAKLKSWVLAVDRRREIARYNQLHDSLVDISLQNYANLAATWGGADRYLVDIFDRNWYQALLDVAIDTRPTLAMFEGHTQSGRVEKFRGLDRWQLKHNRMRVARMHWENLPEHVSVGQMGVLLREFEKKKRHLPIRRLMQSAGNVIQAVKPVFMMSPISVAKYLSPGSLEFDLVVFDEASQIRPANALGAILRGHQVVVTGDSKQLPPTSFFQGVVESNDDESPTADLESILGLFRAKGAPERTLSWHYRSRHPSLIAVSNHEFYNNRLVVFPSPDDSRAEIGLTCHHLPNAYYDRGKSRTNRLEAQNVAEAVIHHAMERPDWTLGVVAFSASQMQAVQDHVEYLRAQNPDCEPFFNDHDHEPFFVKNLENVQGDERDVIFISIGYGRTPDGKLSMGFGPLNRDGGERRLNVMMTRARYRCEVFTNITADDIDLGRTSSAGVVALKRFLQYAATRQIETPTATGRGPDSPFEEEVALVLRSHGCEIEHQVGSAGFSIDLAVKDKQHLGRYVLGIECDGATYHSARSARDRDRLRQEVLEGLGWSIYRIWSTDWFNYCERETERLLTAVEEAHTESRMKQERTQPVVQFTKPPPDVTEIPRLNVEKEPIAAEVDPYVQYVQELPLTDSLHEVPRQKMARWIREVVDVESPIHTDELIRRVRTAAGVGRAGSRIQGTIMRGIAWAQHLGLVNHRGDFVWLPNMFHPPVRDRSRLPVVSRKIELISSEEIREAVRVVLRQSMGIQGQDIPFAVGSLLGFSRTGRQIAEAIEAVIETMVRDGELVRQNGQIVLPRGAH